MVLHDRGNNQVGWRGQAVFTESHDVYNRAEIELCSKQRSKRLPESEYSPHHPTWHHPPEEPRAAIACPQCAGAFARDGASPRTVVTYHGKRRCCYTEVTKYRGYPSFVLAFLLILFSEQTYDKHNIVEQLLMQTLDFFKAVVHLERNARRSFKRQLDENV